MKGSELMTYGGDPVGYALEPTETVGTKPSFLFEHEFFKD
jgi:hypothetical protein